MTRVDFVHDTPTNVYRFRGYYIPERMMESLQRYIVHHTPVGEFLTAVICNDLKEAVGRADDENIMNLPAYIGYLYNEASPNCWGSKEKMTAWLETHTAANVTRMQDDEPKTEAAR